MGRAGGKGPIGRVIGTLFGFGMLALAVGIFLGAKDDPAELIRSGDVVTPTERVHVVYLDRSQSNIRCTATTSGGQAEPLEPFTGAHDEKRFGGKRLFLIPRGKYHRAVGELPLDRGPVTVRCPGASRIWVSAPPNGWSWPIVVFVVIGVACLVVFVVVMLRRRSGTSGPSYPVPPQQGYPGYPQQGYPGYPPPGYPNQGYPPNPNYPNSPG
ncbi:hypothetical protein ACJH6J_17150 [Mycobacterium sp. SMC-18]|uniref:hypothetical protein n=1 Tax=Mycobacteriaceae TaxID=1762 RepID=UPI001BB334C8|nr:MULTISPECIES: hypothetical protein [unclassified Mycolicibacterium]BCI82956.1 hypothetical protein MTY66_45810 [Mycolicibacterium sp. TY66]BCJ79394.1 hypothetical protein MTY81_07670 [Mycolicibacterium sp. TY81]